MRSLQSSSTAIQLWLFSGKDHPPPAPHPHRPYASISLYIHIDNMVAFELELGTILLVQSIQLKRNWQCSFPVITTHPPAPPASSPTSHPPRGNFAPLRAQFMKNRGTLTPKSVPLPKLTSEVIGVCGRWDPARKLGWIWVTHPN